MIVENDFSFLLHQLAYQSPTLLVYLVGLVAAIAYFRRHPTPAVLCLLGVGILLFTGLSTTFVQCYLIHSQIRTSGAVSSQQIAQSMSVLMLAGTMMRAIGSAFLVAAVFAGRRRTAL